jgi:hypothetical protein
LHLVWSYTRMWPWPVGLIGKERSPPGFMAYGTKSFDSVLGEMTVSISIKGLVMMITLLHVVW